MPKFMERTLVETRFDIRNGWIEFALFSPRFVCKTLGCSETKEFLLLFRLNCVL